MWSIVIPSPEVVQLGMKLELTTYPIGTDDDGTEASCLRLPTRLNPNSTTRKRHTSDGHNKKLDS